MTTLPLIDSINVHLSLINARYTANKEIQTESLALIARLREALNVPTGELRVLVKSPNSAVILTVYADSNALYVDTIEHTLDANVLVSVLEEREHDL